MGGRLFLYALKNRELTAGSSRTVCAISQDGKASSEFTEIESKAWLFWRPKSRDGQTWFVPAYWHEHGKATLLQSRDGIHWSIVATIHEGARTDETDIEFLPDRRMLVTSRPEFSDNYLGGSRGGTLVTESGPPYDTRRETAPSKVTRLDGRHLFKYQGKIHGVGRCQPDVE
jgi:hypothetical protein